MKKNILKDITIEEVNELKKQGVPIVEIPMKPPKPKYKIEDLGILKYRFDYFPSEKSGYLKLKNGIIKNVLTLVEGKLMLDRDENGEILGVEILF